MVLCQMPPGDFATRYFSFTRTSCPEVAIGLAHKFACTVTTYEAQEDADCSLFIKRHGGEQVASLPPSVAVSDFKSTWCDVQPPTPANLDVCRGNK